MSSPKLSDYERQTMIKYVNSYGPLDWPVSSKTSDKELTERYNNVHKVWDGLAQKEQDEIKPLQSSDRFTITSPGGGHSFGGQSVQNKVLSSVINPFMVPYKSPGAIGPFNLPANDRWKPEGGKSRNQKFVTRRATKSFGEMAVRNIVKRAVKKNIVKRSFNKKKKVAKVKRVARAIVKKLNKFGF